MYRTWGLPSLVTGGVLAGIATGGVIPSPAPTASSAAAGTFVAAATTCSVAPSLGPPGVVGDGSRRNALTPTMTTTTATTPPIAIAG